MVEFKNNEKFIKRSLEKHGNKFDYSKVKYKRSNEKVIIICPIHEPFLMEPRNHLRSQSGCGKCKNNLKLTNETFINKAKKIHGNKYDYSKINYKNKNSKLKIICHKHGLFEQVARNHIMDGCGCSKCGDESVSKSLSLELNNFIEKSNLKHKNKYNYSKVKYKTNRDKVIITCPLHGEFKQRPIEHLRGCGCQKCKESKGEKIIREFLIQNNIYYLQQHKFDGCVNKNKLPFDFYLPNHQICIEYNGAQHYRPVKYLGGEKTLMEIKKRDKIKKQYCVDNNITLIIIRYNEKIKDKLLKIQPQIYISASISPKGGNEGVYLNFQLH